MKISQLLLPVFIVVFGSAIGLCETNSDSIEYGENYIVIEAEATTSDLGLWIKRTPDDPKYYAGTNIEPVNKTYLEFTGNDLNGGSPKSPIEYKFTCPKTAKYRMVMRMYQPLKDGEAGDKRNDVYIRLEGDYTSGCKYSKEILETDHKFWGRGVRIWGTNHSLEAHVNGWRLMAPVVYKLKEGIEYTFTMSGRAQGCSIDYILFYEDEMDLKIANSDLAANNPELFRPGGSIYNDSVALVRLNAEVLKIYEVGDTKNLEATVYPKSALDSSIVFESSNKSVATIDKDGLVTSLASGITTITARSNLGNKTDICMVPVAAYLETFKDADTWGSKNSKTIKGENGFSWTYKVLNTELINGSRAIYFDAGETGLKSKTIKKGVANFGVTCLNLEDTDIERTIELLINGEVVATMKKTSADAYEFKVDSINIAGDVIISLKNATASSDKAFSIAFDNLYWTKYEVEEPEEPNSIGIVSLGQVEIYPNPTRGLLNIENFESIKSIKVFNTQGQLIFDRNTKTKTIDISSFDPGIYIIQLLDLENRIINNRIIKK